MNINFFENNYYRFIPFLIVIILIISLISYIYLNNKIKFLDKEIELLNIHLGKNNNVKKLEKIKLLDEESSYNKTKLTGLDNLLNDPELKNRELKIKLLKEINLNLLEHMTILNIMNNWNNYIIKGFSYDNDQIVLYNSILGKIENVDSKIIKIEKIDNYFEFQINIEVTK